MKKFLRVVALLLLTGQAGVMAAPPSFDLDIRPLRMAVEDLSKSFPDSYPGADYLKQLYYGYYGVGPQVCLEQQQVTHRITGNIPLRAFNNQ
jgi:hypothetical protein